MATSWQSEKIELQISISDILDEIVQLNKKYGKRPDPMVRKMEVFDIIPSDFATILRELTNNLQLVSDADSYTSLAEKMWAVVNQLAVLIKTDLRPRYRSQIGREGGGGVPKAKEIAEKLKVIFTKAKAVLKNGPLEHHVWNPLSTAALPDPGKGSLSNSSIVSPYKQKALPEKPPSLKMDLTDMVTKIDFLNDSYGKRLLVNAGRISKFDIIPNAYVKEFSDFLASLHLGTAQDGDLFKKLFQRVRGLIQIIKSDILPEYRARGSSISEGSRIIDLLEEIMVLCDRIMAHVNEEWTHHSDSTEKNMSANITTSTNTHAIINVSKIMGYYKQ